MPTTIHTDDESLNRLLPAIRGFLAQDQVSYTIDGDRVHGYRSPDCPALWIRDHSDIVRGARWFDDDLTSAVTHFAATQRANGSLFDFVSCNMDRENWTKYVRVPVEADVEYRFVKAMFLGWQASGDDAWLRQVLPAAARAMDYTLGHAWRFDPGHGLVKRALTMDTWDFDYVRHDQPWLNFQITEDTHWGIFHGDNTGAFEACGLLARLHEHLGDTATAAAWQARAEDLRRRTNELCWNGRFYTHRVPLDDFRIEGVDEGRQLSLSNPMAINRGVADGDQARAMLDEYRDRGAAAGAFAPWYSIDPPYPHGVFGDPKLVGGAYINGGIFPLVGGELARAAFEHGREAFGVEQLRHYAQLIGDRGETYLWYFPDGTPSTPETSTSPEATATDGWGSSAMLWALVEGLAGVVDEAHGYRQVRLSPRWPAAGVRQAEVEVEYPASGARFAYRYRLDDEGCELEMEGHADVALHLLLPAATRVTRFALAGQVTADAGEVRAQRVDATPYADVQLRVAGSGSVRLALAQEK